MRDRMEVDTVAVKQGCKGVTRIESESLAPCTTKCAFVRRIVLKCVINGKVARVLLNCTQTQITCTGGVVLLADSRGRVSSAY
jgi:hypothetical protein